MRPGLCRSIAPLRLIARPHQSIPQTQSNHNQIQKHKRNNSFTHPKTFYEHNTTTQHRKRPIRQRALKGRHSCKAQGGMRAKPDMKPWVYTTQSNIELRRSGTITRAFVLRLVSAAPLGLNRCVSIINPGLAPWAMQEYRPLGALR